MIVPSAHARRAHLPASFFGAQTWTVGPYTGDPAGRLGELRAMRRAGIGSMRVTFSAPYPAAALDSFVLDAARAHVRVLPMLMDASHQAFDGPNRGFTPPAPASFAAYAGALAHRFGPRGTLWAAHPSLRRYAVTTWQVWNEPNLPVYWRPRPSPRAYVAMLAAVSKGIRRYEPRASIITAGIPDSRQSEPLSYTRYLRRLVQLRVRRYVTGIGVPAYAPSVGVLARRLLATRRLLDHGGGRRLRIVVTEMGWADRGHRNRMVVGARRQAKLIAGAYRYAARHRHALRLDGIFYFEWRDPDSLPATAHRTSWGYHTGLLRADGRPKPAYRAFRHVVRELR